MKLLTALSLLISLSALSQRHKYDIPRAEIAPVIDAVINDGECKNESQVELNYEIIPGLNLNASTHTTVYMLENGESLYFAFIAKDKNPENILAFLEREMIPIKMTLLRLYLIPLMMKGEGLNFLLIL